MAHGVEPILPFDLTLTTFLVPDLNQPLSTSDLLTTRACQLQKRQHNLDNIHNHILKSRYASVQQFERQFHKAINFCHKSSNFGPSSLILVCNTGADTPLTNKTKPRYFGPMVVVRRTRNGAYCLAKLDGAVSHLCYASFRLVPYFSRSQTSIPVTRLLDRGDLAAIIKEEATPCDDISDDCDDS